MATIKGSAPAKVNLTLHVTGQRGDGYHLLDSLVVFADLSDRLTVTTASDIDLSVTGPFASGVPSDASNLVWQAAALLRAVRGVHLGARLTLEKNLPHAAGIGSGSSDAAAALALLARLWQVPPLTASDTDIATLGADVPVCMTAPRPIRMAGIGDILTPVPPLPACALVLVRPPVAVPTAQVFARLPDKNGSAMTALPGGLSFDAFADWLRQQRNDLLAPAAAIAPQIDMALAHLRRLPGVAYAGMSGSGATCYGLTRDMAMARNVARALQLAHMDWWVAPAMILGMNNGSLSA